MWLSKDFQTFPVWAKWINIQYTQRISLEVVFAKIVIHSFMTHEFRVIPSANGFQLVCTTKAGDQRVDPD